MKFWSVLASVLLAASFVTAGEADGKGKGEGRRGGGLNPEMIEKTLSGDLAVNAEQKTKIQESYDKHVKPVAEKMKGAADREARRAIMPEMRTASEAFRNEIKAVLNEKQNAKLDEAVAEARKAREAKQNNQ